MIHIADEFRKGNPAMMNEGLRRRKRRAKAENHERWHPDIEPDIDEAIDDTTKPKKKILRVFGGQLSKLATAGEKALRDANEPFFQRGGELVRPIVDQVDASDGRLTKVAQLVSLDAVYVRDRLNIVADWARQHKHDPKSWLPVDCPKDVALTILARKGHWSFDAVAGVISTPTMRPDGTLLTEAGYDKQTRLLLVEPPKLPPMPSRPSRKDAFAALALLDDLIAEFPLVDDVAKAVALSGMVTPVVRGAFPVCPMHVAKAPVAGSGKSYLWDIPGAIVSGHSMPVVAAGRSEEETEKRLGAALMVARPLISIDNVNGDLAGDALCQIIERPLVEVRVLGLSKLMRIEARGTTVYATGNNITVVGDLCRRVVTAILDAGVERPELRTFKGNPTAKVLADRGKYIAACLIICRAYLVAGRPKKAKPLASFAGWSDCVRSALLWLGKGDCVASQETTRTEDPELSKLRDLMSAWCKHFKHNPVTAATVVERANTKDVHTFTPEYSELHAAVNAAAGWRGPADALKLGNYLRKRKGRVVDGMRFAYLPNVKGGSHWWVEPVKK